MIDRFSQIHRKFGFGASGRIALLIVGLIGMAILGALGFNSWWPSVIVVIGLVFGVLLRRQIVDIFEWTTWALPAAGFIFGVLLFVGERIGISREMQLSIITLTTIVVFDLQFWSLSDPSIVRSEDE
jgi:hypothetical protein